MFFYCKTCNRSNVIFIKISFLFWFCTKRVFKPFLWGRYLRLQSVPRANLIKQILSYTDEIYWRCITSILIIPYNVHQGCTTYGPRAKCCPRRLSIWPAKPKSHGLTLFNWKNTLWMGNTSLTFEYGRIFFDPSWDLCFASLMYIII